MNFMKKTAKNVFALSLIALTLSGCNVLGSRVGSTEVSQPTSQSISQTSEQSTSVSEGDDSKTSNVDLSTITNTPTSAPTSTPTSTPTSVPTSTPTSNPTSQGGETDPYPDAITPAQAIALCDDAGEGNVVNKLYKVKGIGSSTVYNSQYTSWDGRFKDSQLTFDSVKTSQSYSTLDGYIIVIEGYLELYNGVYKLGYLPKTASPTGAKFNPTLV